MYYAVTLIGVFLAGLALNLALYGRANDENEDR